MKTKTIARVNVKNANVKRQEFYTIACKNLNDIESVHISMGNSKMGQIPSFSVLPLITCKNCSACSEFCYACKGCFNFNSNIMNLAENTAMVTYRFNDTLTQINNFLNNGTTIYKYFRFNVSGDIYCNNYMALIVTIAELNPFTKFLVFTKNYELFNNYGGSIPSNLTIVFSKWNNTEIDNPKNYPIAIVKTGEETEIPETAYHCSGDCANCLECWNAKNGTTRYFDLH